MKEERELNKTEDNLSDSQADNEQKRKGNISIFWTVYIVFFAVLIIACVCFLFAFNKFIKKFENNKVLENESIAQSLEAKLYQESKEYEAFFDEVVTKKVISSISEGGKEIVLIKEPLAKEDISNLVRSYSLFTSGDLPGPENGIKQLLPYIVKNTKLYDMIVYFSISYVDGVKIHHTLGDPPFRNEKIGEIVPLSNTEFLVHVSIDKVMLDSKKEEYLDHFETDMIFQYDYNTKSWKWASTKD